MKLRLGQSYRKNLDNSPIPITTVLASNILVITLLKGLGLDEYNIRDGLRATEEDNQVMLDLKMAL